MSLPPGVRPLHLPRAPQVTEMKIGPRTVRVQKILMTKAEVEAMTKQGLVQIKVRIPLNCFMPVPTVITYDIRRSKAVPSTCLTTS